MQQKRAALVETAPPHITSHHSAGREAPMNDDNTPDATQAGKYTHTSGCLIIDPNNPCAVQMVQEDDNDIGYAFAYVYGLPIDGTHGPIDAHRIAAAWNACEGIPTEALDGGVVGELVEAAKDLDCATADTLRGWTVDDVALQPAKAHGVLMQLAEFCDKLGKAVAKAEVKP
jgi:hypothetical protein